MDQKELILELIKADLCNKKLIKGLENAGLTVEDFYGDLETVVLNLMGFDLKQREDEMHELYYQIMDQLMEIEVKEIRKNVTAMTEKMYLALLKY